MALLEKPATMKHSKHGRFLGTAIARMHRVVRTFWRGLREWCGDAAYERYECATATKNSASDKLSPSEFYVEQLNRRYSRPSRCC